MRQGAIILALGVILLAGCQPAATENEQNKDIAMNQLAGSTSPYLLQHANNPVHWYPWGQEALSRALEEDKPILVSIGYSSCHWCHVMEKESFENDSIAGIMNENFICIKVDREERPDIDQIYMDAVQAMGINGGWPLNVFLTPDQKPFYGGTYFPPKNWAQLLSNISNAFQNRRSEIEESAEQLTDAIGTSELLRFKLKPDDTPYTAEQQQAMFERITTKFDTVQGGLNRAPKFPMPSIWKWMLHYGVLSKDEQALDQLDRTLTAMAYGGIYDQIGGGFARYSTDAEWLVPHFEKMLYDNAQLMSLYARAYQHSGRADYKEVMIRTIEWLEREMTSEDGGFYSALDADSEGVEGKYYVWSFREFDQILGKNTPLMSSYYQVSAEGNWEGTNILNRVVSDEVFATKKGLTLSEWDSIKEESRKLLLTARSSRIRPGLDNKTISGWNAMMISGLLDVYDALDDTRYLDLAVRNANFIVSQAIQDDMLYRTPPTGSTQIPGYLEDYAFTINAFVDLYERTFDEIWLKRAEGLTNYVMENFLDTSEDMFFFTDGSTHDLVVRKKEIFDNVIPSSNSQMAINLFRLGKMLDRTIWMELSNLMLSRMAPMIPEAVSDMANWADLHLLRTYDVSEVIIAGTNALEMRQRFVDRLIPNKIIMGTTTSSELPLIRGKSMLNGKTTIYVCYNKTCKLPVNTIEEAYSQLR
ncbi:thioredoxin domain-containing protein [Fulvivirga sedimenti]|uniref:Thioredoxin domain-containing protein n=1 Tax=Fulvivirga sedimenti TaxID=2879465 RepID=A0A9X1KUM0_9BACT|nr:thioredoxin domain-containing protein [Fulvivirga sedimenti]MCA6073653.1 thioredoxin domain-containing protein [Fulvivirga sedimenti]